MGKPDKFKISSLGFTGLSYTLQEMKEKMCKVAKKLQKRIKRKQKVQPGAVYIYTEIKALPFYYRQSFIIYQYSQVCQTSTCSYILQSINSANRLKGSVEVQMVGKFGV